MSGNGNGKNGYNRPEIVQQWEVEYWATLSLEIVEHGMSRLFDEWERVYWTIVRCGPCHPHQNAMAVRPRLKQGGFPKWIEELHERILKKRPVKPGELKNELADLDEHGGPVALSGVDIGMIQRMKKPNVSRALEKCRELGLLKEGFPYYPNPKPSVVPPDFPVISTDNSEDKNILNKGPWKVADLVISTDQFPADPVIRNEAIRWVSELSTDWKKAHVSLRTEWRKRVREGCIDYGILIKRSKTLRPKKGESVRADSSTVQEGHANGTSKARTHAPQPPPSSTDPDEAVLYSQIQAMQEAFPHSPFSEKRISWEHAGDRKTLAKIAAIVKGETLGFCQWIAMQFKNGRAPDRANGPQSLGLLEKWANDYMGELRKQQGRGQGHAATR